MRGSFCACSHMECGLSVLLTYIVIVGNARLVESMAISRQWTEWHLTPRLGFRIHRRDGQGNVWRDEPVDRVVTFVYQEQIDKAHLEPHATVQESWRSKDVGAAPTSSAYSPSMVPVRKNSSRPLLRSRFGAQLIHRPGQFLGDHRRRRGLDGGTLHQVHQLAVAKNCDRRRSRRMTLEVGPGAFRGF